MTFGPSPGVPVPEMLFPDGIVFLAQQQGTVETLETIALVLTLWLGKELQDHGRERAGGGRGL